MEIITKTAEWTNSRGTKQSYKITLMYGHKTYQDDIAGEVKGAYMASLTGEVSANGNSYLGLGLTPCTDVPGAVAKIGPMAVRAEIAAKYQADYDELVNHPAYVAYERARKLADQVDAEYHASQRRIDRAMTLNGRTY